MSFVPLIALPDLPDPDPQKTLANGVMFVPGEQPVEEAEVAQGRCASCGV
jgi:hypothetical protein